ncbi:hypothetical protein [Alteromonas sp. C1M14]|uniref:hypothetical protein n=1 Tax=Alteromonas sp. C1M14 TaxID=2841567 RepID=UPI001C094099|nr:hypothetical protein [Alteromonas sp. C1M14]MBU2977107.1 hypothetical protein [Alteromonas sp. C1M14]
MEISQFNGLMQANTMGGVNSAQSQPPPPPPKQADELSDYMADSGDDEDVKAFMESIMDMESSGEFDAETLAATAPSSMQSFAADNGINLTDFFQQKHEQHVSRGGPQGNMPPPPAANSQTLAYSSTEQLGSASGSLMDKLTSSVGISTSA